MTVARQLFVLDEQLAPEPSSLHVDIERAAVDLLTTVPPLPGREGEHLLAKAESLHKLMIRLRETDGLRRRLTYRPGSSPPTRTPPHQPESPPCSFDVTSRTWLVN